MRIGNKVKFTLAGRACSGVITGKHGSEDYYSVKTDSGNVIYLWAADMEVIRCTRT